MHVHLEHPMLVAMVGGTGKTHVLCLPGADFWEKIKCIILLPWKYSVLIKTVMKQKVWDYLNRLGKVDSVEKEQGTVAGAWSWQSFTFPFGFKCFLLIFSSVTRFLDFKQKDE